MSKGFTYGDEKNPVDPATVNRWMDQVDRDKDELYAQIQELKKRIEALEASA